MLQKYKTHQFVSVITDGYVHTSVWSCVRWTVSVGGGETDLPRVAAWRFSRGSVGKGRGGTCGQ